VGVSYSPVKSVVRGPKIDGRLTVGVGKEVKFTTVVVEKSVILIVRGNRNLATIPAKSL
jgi:hypothetical protein